MVRRRLAIAALILLSACGGSDEKKETTGPAPGGTGGTPPASSEQKLRAAQDSAVTAMCERLATCAVEDLKHASPEERKQVGDVNELLPRLRADCEEQQSEHSLSPRQIRIIQRCVNGAQQCPELLTCLDEANKK